MSKLDFKQDPDTRFTPVDELSHEEAHREVEALREAIEYHDHRYYIENKPWDRAAGPRPPRSCADWRTAPRPAPPAPDSTLETPPSAETVPLERPACRAAWSRAAVLVQRRGAHLPSEVARRPLDLIFYDILHVDGASPTTHWDELKALKRWGLKTDAHNRQCASLDEVRKFHARLAEQRQGLDYEFDGVVLKADALQLWEELGTRDRSPRWALAWKFEPRQEVTRLRQIVVQVGMTGTLTPVGLLEPVEVGGVTVSRADPEADAEAEALAKLGFQRLLTLTPEIAREYELDTARGILVVDVRRFSTAAIAGLRRGTIRRSARAGSDRRRCASRGRRGAGFASRCTDASAHSGRSGALRAPVASVERRK